MQRLLLSVTALFSWCACARSQPQQVPDLAEVMCGDDNPSCKVMVTKFSEWKKTHDKEYTGDLHHQKAFLKFHESEKRINAHNERGHSWTMGHNAFSDLTPEEFKIMFSSPMPKRTENELNPAKLSHVPTPKSVDWVKRGAVGPVQDQGRCNSCVSFSAAGAIEGHYQIATGNLTSLSVQEVVDCNTPDFGFGGHGCQGSYIDETFAFVSNFTGLCAAQDYPYTGTQGKCRGTQGFGPSCTPVAAVKGFVDVASETDLLKAVSLGPVSAGIDSSADIFHNYKSGVIDADCGTYLDHAILIVGFGTDKDTGLDYWKIKNTWGSAWGEDGYARLVRGKNMCGIASYPPSYPTGVGPAKVQAFQPPSPQISDLIEVMCGDDHNPSCEAVVRESEKDTSSGSAETVPAATCQFSATDACANSPPKQKVDCLMQLSKELFSRAHKLGFQAPLRTYTVVTSSGEAVHLSQHELGCSGWFNNCDPHAEKCALCSKAVPVLAKQGSKELCTALCTPIVEAVGAGPEDTVADAVASACPVICGQIFSADGNAAAGPVCRAAHLC